MRVLFIGNSHTYFNDMPALFAAFCRHGGVDTEVTMLSHSGQSLEWHRKEYFETRFNILHGHYDICILQQHAHPFPDPEQTGKTVGEFIALCRAADTRPALLMTWAEKAHPEDQAIMTEVYQKMAAEHDALLIPVGQVWETVRREHPEIELYWSDGKHASVYGSYLVAATVYATLTGKSTKDLPATAADFSLPEGLDLEHPLLRETPDVFFDAREDWCRAICQAVDRQMEENAKA